MKGAYYHAVNSPVPAAAKEPSGGLSPEASGETDRERKGASAWIDIELAGETLRRGMLEEDLGLKEAASRLSRSVGTVKRALRGTMGPRTAYKIMKEFASSRPERIPDQMSAAKFF